MNKIAKQIKHLILIASAVAVVSLTTGCSSMSALSSNESFVFGKIYAMQDAFNEAAKNCDDTTRTRAQSWAAIGFEDLSQSTAYMDRESDEYQHASALVSHLGAISRRTKDTRNTCENIKVAATATSEYLVAIKANRNTVAMR